MARIKMDEVVSALGNETKLALEDALEEVLPKVRFDRDTLFQAFQRAIDRRCSRWENVPDDAVECDHPRRLL